MKMWSWRRTALLTSVIAALCYPAWASILHVQGSLGIPAIDSYGNPDFDVLFNCSGKFFKEDHTSTVIGLAQGKVLNKSGSAQTYINIGYPLYDPWTGHALYATQDELLVSRPTKSWSQAGVVAIYYPLSRVP
jgi:hypothetical protein